ncbi:MAG: hypothetical protein R3F65_09590 [bacterium]
MRPALLALLLTGCGVIVDPDDAGLDGGADAGACALPAGRYTLTWRLDAAESEGACAPIAPGVMNARDDDCPASCRCEVEDSGEDGDCVRTLTRSCREAGAATRLECTFPHDGDGTPFGGECHYDRDDTAGRPVARCVYDMTASRVE